jgi:hypothetical protein
MACTAKQTSMNQVLVDFIEEWANENDPFRQQPPTPEKGKSKKGVRSE